MALIYDNYRGKIEYGGELFAFMPATLEDAAQIAGMYDEISINENNFRTKLDPDNEESFARTGGMFAIHDRESIEKEIRLGKTFFALAKSRAGEIAASFWFGGDGKTAHPLELICRPGKLHNAAHVMFYTIFAALAENGYTSSLFEVYAVRGYSFDGQNIPLDMLNRRSFEMSLSMGAKHMGSLKDFDIPLGRLTVTISPQVFFCDYAEILPKLGQELTAEGLKISFDRVDGV